MYFPRAPQFLAQRIAGSGYEIASFQPTTTPPIPHPTPYNLKPYPLSPKPLQPNTTSSTTIPQTTTTTTHSTITTYHKLVELNHQKAQHTRQIALLHKHITNHKTPTGLTITMQPWVQLSQKHQAANGTLVSRNA